MLLSAQVYGSTAVRHVQERIDRAVLKVGRDRLTRADLAGVACFSFVAAQNLTALLETVNVDSLAQLYQKISPYDLAIPKLGVISLMVLGAAFEVKGIGTIESWAEKHRRSDQDHLLSFTAIKAKHEHNGHATTRRRQRGGRRKKS